MSWCSVRPSRNGTRIMPRRACSVALRMASGTSRALPAPKPTRPFLSPTTTRAAKPNRRPPFTTFATRLMLTSFSVNSLSSRSRDCRSPSPRPRRSPCVRAMLTPLKVETAVAGRVGQSFHPAVKEIGAPIKYHPFNSCRSCPLGDELADGTRRSHVCAGSEARPETLVEARGRGQCPPGRIIDDLRVDVLRRAKNRKTQATVRRAAHTRPHSLSPAQKEGLG